MQKYEDGQVPADAHLLIVAADSEPQWHQILGARKVSYLTAIPAQKLGLYWVGN